MKNKPDNKTKATSCLDLSTGPIEYPLMRDVVLHIVLQDSNIALRGLVCALMGLKEADVSEVILVNPIDYNTQFRETTLDILVELNNHERLNIELQVERDRQWVDRSVLYLCRAYNNIKRGEAYQNIRPTTHIGILDFTLFPEEPREFYAKYLLTNTRTGHVYTTKLALNVLSLKHIDQATKEDHDNQLVYWARMFKAQTWEEIKQLVSECNSLEEVAHTMQTIDADVAKQTYIRAHEKYLEMLASERYARAELEQEIKEKDLRLTDLEQKIRELEQQIADLIS